MEPVKQFLWIAIFLEAIAMGLTHSGHKEPVPESIEQSALSRDYTSPPAIRKNAGNTGDEPQRISRYEEYKSAWK